MRTSDYSDEYAALRDRCLAKRPDEEAYIRGLYALWSEELARDLEIEERMRPAVEHLVRSARGSRSSLEWLNALPSALMDMATGDLKRAAGV